MAKVILHALNFRRLRERPLAFLEITPPSITTKTPLATAQFYTALHGLLGALTRKEHWLNRQHVMALEVVTTRNDGIRFIVPLAPPDVTQFQHMLTSYLPTVRFREVEDYLPADLDASSVDIVELKQLGSFAYSLNLQDILSQHDP